MSTAISARPQTRADLSGSRFDLLVIGGGIVGTSVTWTAAQAGLRVAMVDAGDFAGATSSASTKLVHGGLRYLQTGSFRLVAENHRERHALAETVAPHLVKPLDFLIPVFRGGPHAAAKLGAGVFLYSALSSFEAGVGRIITSKQAAERIPALRTDGLRGAAVYRDHQMNDSRVAVMVVRAGVIAGAQVLNYAEVVGLHTTRGRITGADIRDRIDGSEFSVEATVVLNATGPWTDQLRRMEDPAAAPQVRLSKGAHVVLRQAQPWRAALTVPLDRYRVSFAIPWEGHVLLGTTDEEYHGDPRDVTANDGDIRRVLDEAGGALHGYQLRRDDVTYAFAGLRALPDGSGSVTSARRETIISCGRGGMLSIAGGKWTSFRHIGKAVLETLRRLPDQPLGSLASAPPAVPLPGVASSDAVARSLLAAAGNNGTKLDPESATHLGR